MKRVRSCRIKTASIGILLIAMLLLGTPGASAQIIPGCDLINQPNLGATLTGSSEPLEPRQLTTILLEWEYTAPPTAFSIVPLEATFFIDDAPEWAHVTLLKQVEFISLAPEATVEPRQASGEVPARVQLTADAPAGAVDNLTIRVDVSDGDCVAAATLVVQTNIATAEQEEDDETEEQVTPDEVSLPGVPAIVLAGSLLLAARALRHRHK